MVKRIINKSDMNQKQPGDYVLARSTLAKSLNIAHEAVIEGIIDKFAADFPPILTEKLSIIVTALDDAIAACSELPCAFPISKSSFNR